MKRIVTVEIDEALAEWLLNHFRDGVGFSKSAYEAVAEAMDRRFSTALLSTPVGKTGERRVDR